jgi:uncharacterized oxidoreductase
MEIKNNTILITGGSSGIGLELVKQLTENGAAAIIITGRDLSRLEQVKLRFPKVHIIQSDAGDIKDNLLLFETVVKQFPKLNIIINNAGIMRDINLQNAARDQEDVLAEIDINLSGVIRIVQHFLPHLLTKPSAAIVNVSSALAFVPFPASPIYSASKAGLHAYTRVLRLQLKNTKIKVFELIPPSTDTPIQVAIAGLVDQRQNMATDKMVKIAIKGILNDDLEIKPGMSKLIKLISRLMPELFINFLDRSINKARAKNLHS